MQHVSRHRTDICRIDGEKVRAFSVSVATEWRDKCLRFTDANNIFDKSGSDHLDHRHAGLRQSYFERRGTNRRGSCGDASEGNSGADYSGLRQVSSGSTGNKSNFAGRLFPSRENLMPATTDISLPPPRLPSHAVLDRAPTPGGLRTDDNEITDWAPLVQRIRENDGAAMGELYGIFAKGIRYFLLRNLGPQDLDDKVHDCFLIVAQAIRNGDLREPNRLMGYVRTVVKRQIAGSIDIAVHQRRKRVEFDDSLFSVSDGKDNPESTLLARQRVEIARKVLSGVSRRDREILKRFYLLEQSQEQICREMGLSYNQFRLLKSRAKARFGELGKQIALVGKG
jgi:RNA polymerase sigma factor (sigma-70 family)